MYENSLHSSKSPRLLTRPGIVHCSTLLVGSFRVPSPCKSLNGEVMNCPCTPFIRSIHCRDTPEGSARTESVNGRLGILRPAFGSSLTTTSRSTGIRFTSCIAGFAGFFGHGVTVFCQSIACVCLTRHFSWHNDQLSLVSSRPETSRSPCHEGHQVVIVFPLSLQDHRSAQNLNWNERADTA
ncbi:hypothetical protein RRG08_031039 [Elysia crispata]|uniref:Uncharacterized protein n=1 Tax=Elysia crispata TaxID=231223 RepID=A0AAE0ZFA1_9GAST|nr:hypothetical protein RRG08_031039 [Elysia crispata]